MRGSLLAGWVSSVPTFQIQHRPGAQHKNANALCRRCGFHSGCDKDKSIAQSVIKTISENKVKAIERNDPSSSLRAKQDEDTDVSLMKNRV